MFRYLIHRLLIMIPTLLVISVVTFLIIQAPPGDYLSNEMARLRFSSFVARCQASSMPST